MGTVSIARSSPRQEYKMHLIFLSVALVCSSALELEDIANVRKGSEGTDVSNNRKPKLFFVSSASTTSTVKTDAVCYVSTSAAGFTLASCKRRKRAFISEAVDHVPEVEPSQVESGMDDTASEGRQGKFLLYWLTTTSTSITTEYTKTVTVYSVSCTPSGATVC